MAYRKILEFPNQLLRKKSEPVTVFDDELRALADDLHDTLNVANGAGLSAPQIGVFQRVIYIGVGKFTGVMINPTIIEVQSPASLGEGCLSFPGIFENVNRFQTVQCRYQDVAGDEHDITVSKVSAHVIQHEIEHLDGVLLIDKLSRLKRARLQRKTKKKARLMKAAIRQEQAPPRKKKNSSLSKKELKIRKKRKLQARR